ncbi:MAG: hypothetical protein K0S33_1719 [Bacteroidetes bacterium]|jgi:DNA-binding CsgD family transcriptional regulator|nr:hypothetical protein [Bacteroidota bacterium]
MTELSIKESKLLRLICDDYNNSEIAEKMEYGLRYIEKIKTALFKKTKTSSNIGLLKWAVLNGHYVIKRKSTTKRPTRK